MQLEKTVNLKLNRNNGVISIKIPREKVPDKPDSIFLLPAGLNRPVIDSVVKNSPAEKAGIMSGDIFLELNNVPIQLRQQVNAEVSSNQNKELPLRLTSRARYCNIKHYARQ